MLTGFTAGLLLITFSELGDKSFFIAVVLAMRHPKSLVFWGTIAALAVMTVISVLLGQTANLLPPAYVRYAEAAILVIFGLTSIWKAGRIPKHACMTELQSAEDELRSARINLSMYGSTLGVLLKAFSLTFLGEWGDRTQFATITLAAGNDALGVTMGSIFGHGICTAIAITSGCLLAERISERTLAYIGGGLFILFGAIAWFSRS
ncbi:MAG: TMEM165/GDT1 family protein [Pseudanabaena sp. RU_4_16]|nr:TMEM165/GDT1 family protein [Pseudanabaena sp. RU_4_16]